MALAGSDLRTTRVWREFSARVRQPRRVAVAVLAGIAALLGIHAARPAPPRVHAIWVAARDLTGGAPLTQADVRLSQFPVADVPAGALPAGTPPSGRLLAAPVRRGEPLTDVRLLSPALLSALDRPGTVAVPVRVSDGPAAIALVHTGDLIDVLAAASTDPTGDPAIDGATVVHDVRVLATPPDPTPSSADGSTAGGLLIVAASHRQASALATAASRSELSVAVRRPA